LVATAGAAGEKQLVPRKMISQPPLHYPPAAMRDGLEGTVELKATVEASGEVSKVEVVSGHEKLNEAAVEAVKQRKYEPYQERTVVPVRVLFKLPRPSRPPEK
jgi:protein TonB